MTSKDWRGYQQSLGPAMPGGTGHYGVDVTAEMDFTPRKNSATGSAAFFGFCLGALVVGAAGWLLVLHSCDATTCASPWVW
jgi:hypothetical protein